MPDKMQTRRDARLAENSVKVEFPKLQEFDDKKNVAGCMKTDHTSSCTAMVNTEKLELKVFSERKENISKFCVKVDDAGNAGHGGAAADRKLGVDEKREKLHFDDKKDFAGCMKTEHTSSCTVTVYAEKLEPKVFSEPEENVSKFCVKVDDAGNASHGGAAADSKLGVDVKSEKLHLEKAVKSLKRRVAKRIDCSVVTARKTPQHFGDKSCSRASERRNKRATAGFFPDDDMKNFLNNNSSDDNTDVEAGGQHPWETYNKQRKEAAVEFDSLRVSAKKQKVFEKLGNSAF